MIDKQELENGSLVSQTRQIYALTRDDIFGDPSIIEILRRNLGSSDPELLEITIMRLGIRAIDFDSIDIFFDLLVSNANSLVRSAILGALSSLHFKMYDLDAKRARDILDRIGRAELSTKEVEQVRKQFGRNLRAKGIKIDDGNLLSLGGTNS